MIKKHKLMVYKNENKPCLYFNLRCMKEISPTDDELGFPEEPEQNEDDEKRQDGRFVEVHQSQILIALAQDGSNVIRAIRLVLFVGCHLSFFPSEK